MNATNPRLYQPKSRRRTPSTPTQFGDTSNTIPRKSQFGICITDKINRNPDRTSRNEEKAQLQRELAALHRQVAHVFERLAALEAEDGEEMKDARSTAE
ncbi:MAG: hypothetical protein Q9226_007613 [Calogaya cf. arnoldii]